MSNVEIQYLPNTQQLNCHIGSYVLLYFFRVVHMFVFLMFVNCAGIPSIGWNAPSVLDVMVHLECFYRESDF